MSTPVHSIQGQLTMAQIAISNVLADRALVAAFNAYGYSAERLQEGQSLRQRALALQHQQRVAYGDLSSATDALRAAQAHAQTVYMHDVKVARLAFAADRGMLQKLDVAVKRRQVRAAWLVQAQQFYANALSNPAILEAFAKYGVTQERLEAGRQQIDAVDACYAAQQDQRGVALEATRVRNEALDALEVWMREFRQVARMALKSQPQYLERLGLVART